MLIDILGVIINNPLKEKFYGKRKKKTINILTVFFISHKSDIKTFLKLIINHCFKEMTKIKKLDETHDPKLDSN